jgi:hypothetical protein
MPSLTGYGSDNQGLVLRDEVAGFLCPLVRAMGLTLAQIQAL